jgi:two-component system NarL family sensor kinase
MQLRDEERRRIARDLHDSLGQLIAAARMSLGALRSQQGRMDACGVRALSEMTEMLEEMTRQTRTVSHLLHPPLLDEVGLKSALRWFVEEFSERSGIKVSIEIPEDLGRLSDDLEIAVFRIVQECLTNIHRHSGSAVASVILSQAGGRVSLRIADQGRGISAEKLAELRSSRVRGVGFRGMQERVRYLGGNWDVQSDGHGTVITVSLPMELARSAAGS